MLSPNKKVCLASSSQTERFDLQQDMLYETIEEDFCAGIQSFPNKIICRILSFLPPKKLLEAGRVCKLWYQLASRDCFWKSYQLKELFPRVPFINRNVWDVYVDLKEHGLEFKQEGCPCVANKRHYLDLLRMASEVEDGQGISILTLPKGLSMNKIIAFATVPEPGNTTKIHVFRQRIIEEQGDVELKETVTVAITNGVFKNSRKRNVAEQIELVKSLKCEMPQVVAVMALTILRFMSSDRNNPLRLFSNNPLTYTRCLEIVEGANLFFGDFDSSGPDLYNAQLGGESRGVGGMREFAESQDLVPLGREN